MSGHSKWSTIKRKKGAKDAARGKVFSKLNKEIMVAARTGGGDPDANARLRRAISAARAQSMPNDNIDRAIKKATGDLAGVEYVEITFECYGPAGVAILVDTLTDNRNRTVPELRHLLSKRGYALAESGSAAHNFTRRGQVLVAIGDADTDELFEIALEAGADDASVQGDDYEVLCDISVLEDVARAFEKADKNPREYGMIFHPNLWVPVAGDNARKCMELIEAIEDNDDVQKVWANLDISDEEMEALDL